MSCAYCRHTSGHEPSVQSLKQMFASNTAQRADADGTQRQTGFASEEDVEMDPEYAPKRALTTKV